MLKLIRKDRPNQVIHKVLSFEKIKHGYIVEVDMELMFYKTKILHTIFKLPYPLPKQIKF